MTVPCPRVRVDSSWVDVTDMTVIQCVIYRLVVLSVVGRTGHLTCPLSHYTDLCCYNSIFIRPTLRTITLTCAMSMYIKHSAMTSARHWIKKKYCTHSVSLSTHLSLMKLCITISHPALLGSGLEEIVNITASCHRRSWHQV